MFDKENIGSLKLKFLKYFLINGHLFWKDPGGVLLSYVDEDEVDMIMVDFHKGVCGGKHYWKGTSYKILRGRYYWPTLFSDVNGKVRACTEH